MDVPLSMPMEVKMQIMDITALRFSIAHNILI